VEVLLCSSVLVLICIFGHTGKQRTAKMAVCKFLQFLLVHDACNIAEVNYIVQSKFGFTVCQVLVCHI